MSQALFIAGGVLWLTVPVWRGWRHEAVTVPEFVLWIAGLLLIFGLFGSWER